MSIRVGLPSRDHGVPPRYTLNVEGTRTALVVFCLVATATSARGSEPPPNDGADFDTCVFADPAQHHAAIQDLLTRWLGGDGGGVSAAAMCSRYVPPAVLGREPIAQVQPEGSPLQVVVPIANAVNVATGAQVTDAAGAILTEALLLDVLACGEHQAAARPPWCGSLIELTISDSAANPLTVQLWNGSIQTTAHYPQLAACVGGVFARSPALQGARSPDIVREISMLLVPVAPPDAQRP